MSVRGWVWLGQVWLGRATKYTDQRSNAGSTPAGSTIGSAWSGKSSRGVVWLGELWLGMGILEAVRLVEGPVSKAGKGLMKASAGSIPVASSMGTKSSVGCKHCRICLTPEVLYCYDCLKLFRLPAQWQITKWFCMPDTCEPVYA